MRALLLALLLLCSTGCGHKEVGKRQPAAVTVAAVVKTTAASDAETYSGTVTPYVQVSLAFKNGGYVDRIMQVPHDVGPSLSLRPGDFVRAGDVLAVVRERDYQARVMQAQAQADAAQSQADQAAAAVGQARAVLAQATQGVVQAERAVNQAQAAVLNAQALLGEAQGQLTSAQAAQTDANLNYQRAQRLFAVEAITKPSYDSAVQSWQQAGGQVETAQSQVTAARAGIESAKAQLESAKSKVPQAAAVVAQQQAAVAQAAAAAQTAQANARGAGASLLQAQEALDDCFLRAPMDSVVMARNVEVGTLVAAGTVGFTLGDVRNIKVVFAVADRDVNRLQVGQRLTVRIPAAAAALLQGRISSVAPAADSKTRVFNVEVTVPNPQRRIMAGMIASVDLAAPAAKREGLAVPLAALVRPQGKSEGYAVYVVQDGTARTRDVTVGQPVGDLMIVHSGLREGERVIVTGAQMIADGDPVHLTD